MSGTKLPKVVDLAKWRAKRLILQSQEEYIGKLCARCAAPGLPPCGGPELERLAEIQRRIILELLGAAPEAGTSQGKEPEGRGE